MQCIAANTALVLFFAFDYPSSLVVPALIARLVRRLGILAIRTDSRRYSRQIIMRPAFAGA